jgi:hypothetical protein
MRYLPNSGATQGDESMSPAATRDHYGGGRRQIIAAQSPILTFTGVRKSATLQSRKIICRHSQL